MLKFTPAQTFSDRDGQKPDHDRSCFISMILATVLGINQTARRIVRLVVTLVVVVIALIMLHPAEMALAYPAAQDNAQPTVDESKHQSEQAPGSIAGRVVDGEGRPLGGINVQLFANDSNSVEQNRQTEPDGTYRFAFLGAGNYRIGFADPSDRFLQNFYPNAATLAEAGTVFVASNDVQLEDVQLVAASAIQGRISTTNGQAITSAFVSLYENADNGETLSSTHPEINTVSIITPTDSITYTWSGLTAGVYRLCASGVISEANVQVSNCYNQAGEDVNAAQDITVTVGMTAANIDIELEVKEFAAITGTVTSILGGPLSGIRITTYISNTVSGWNVVSEDILTDKNGRYSINHLVEGIYTFSYHSANMPFASELYGGASSLESATTIQLSAGEMRPDVNAALYGPVISGTVTSEAGEPLSGISVYAFWWDPNRSEYGSSTAVRTDENGNYQKVLFYSGRWTLYFEDPGDAFVDAYLGNSPTLENAEAITLTKRDIQTNVDFVARTGAKVSGTVTLNGAPFSRRFRVQPYLLVDGEWTEGAPTFVEDPNGAFTVPGLRPGRYKFAVEAVFREITLYQFYGNQDIETATEVEVNVGKDIHGIDVNLETELFDGALAGRVTYQDEPVENILVAIDRRPDGYHLPTIELYTDAEGDFQAEGVTPGNYCVRFSDPQGKYATNNFGQHRPGAQCDRIILEAGEVRDDLNHSLMLGGTISGKVTEFKGLPTDDIEVTAFVYDRGIQWWADTHVKTMVDENGNYALTGLLPRSYRLRFRHIDDQGVVSGHEEYLGGKYDINRAQDVVVLSGQSLQNVNYWFGAIEHLRTELFMPMILSQ